MRPILDAKLSGSFSCCKATANGPVDAWRARDDTRDAALISVCSHGAGRSISGCDAKIYQRQSVTTYPEVPGAVIHLLACESLAELAPALVAVGGARAVIGYSEPFSLFIPAGEEPATLPESTRSALACDAQVLFALADGKTVNAAIAEAKTWAGDEAESLMDLARASRGEERTFLAVLWRHAVLTTNASHLGVRGDGNATVT